MFYEQNKQKERERRRTYPPADSFNIASKLVEKSINKESGYVTPSFRPLTEQEKEVFDKEGWAKSCETYSDICKKILIVYDLYETDFTVASFEQFIQENKVDIEFSGFLYEMLRLKIISETALLKHLPRILKDLATYLRNQNLEK